MHPELERFGASARRLEHAATRPVARMEGPEFFTCDTGSLALTWSHPPC